MRRPPLDLRVEHRRQKALEHNTLICLGYLDGDYVEGPDPESGLQLTDRMGRVRLTWNVEGKADAPSRSLKRPSSIPPDHLSDSSEIILLFSFDYPSLLTLTPGIEMDAKKRKISLPITNRLRAGHKLELTGTLWDSRN